MVETKISTLSRQLNEKIRFQISRSLKKKKKKKKHTVDFCLESDGADLDSSIGGLSIDEEQEIDDMLADNYERWAGFSLVFALVSVEVMCGLVGFRYSKA